MKANGFYRADEFTRGEEGRLSGRTARTSPAGPEPRGPGRPPRRAGGSEGPRSAPGFPPRRPPGRAPCPPPAAAGRVAAGPGGRGSLRRLSAPGPAACTPGGRRRGLLLFAAPLETPPPAGECRGAAVPRGDRGRFVPGGCAGGSLHLEPCWCPGVVLPYGESWVNSVAEEFRMRADPFASLLCCKSSKQNGCAVFNFLLEADGIRR